MSTLNLELNPPTLLRHVDNADVYVDTASGERFTVPTEDHGRCDNGHALDDDVSPCSECNR